MDLRQFLGFGELLKSNAYLILDFLKNSIFATYFRQTKKTCRKTPKTCKKPVEKNMSKLCQKIAEKL